MKHWFTRIAIAICLQYGISLHPPPTSHKPRIYRHTGKLPTVCSRWFESSTIRLFGGRDSILNLPFPPLYHLPPLFTGAMAPLISAAIAMSCYSSCLCLKHPFPQFPILLLSKETKKEWQIRANISSYQP